MDYHEPPKSAALRDMYWRSEILQVMYWLRGEGLATVVDAPMVEQFLGVPTGAVAPYLARLAGEGYLEHDGGWYSLSEAGLAEGAVEFAMSFSELTRPTHGECSDDCWCHASADEAATCAAERAHGHGT